MRFTIQRARQYRKTPILECPACRLKPFWYPKFFIESEGRRYFEDVSCRVNLLNRTYYFHSVHDETNIVGYICIYYGEGYFEKEWSFHIDNLSELEQFAKPFGDLVQDLRKAKSCTLSTEDDFDYLKKQLQKAAVTFEQLNDCQLTTKELEDFIDSEANPF